MSKKILIIDDEKEICKTISRILNDEGYNSTVAMNGVDALELIRGHKFDLIIIDIWMPGIDGFKTIENIKKIDDESSIIIISGHKNEKNTLQAIKLGIYDFIEKPFSINRLLTAVTYAIEIKYLKKENKNLKEEIKKENGFIIESKIYPSLSTLSNKDIILIIGEEGTEKETVARYIYEKKIEGKEIKNKGYFVKINCKKLPYDLLEEEIFGYVKGTFPKALADKIGILEEGNNGTIFFENIICLNLTLQTKLLQVLKTKEFKKIGSKEVIKLAIQIICSTDSNLEEEIEKGKFSEELGSLLKVNLIFLLPLRKRKEEILKFAKYFFRLFCQKYEKKEIICSKETLKVLAEHPFLYNVDELKNLIEKLVITASDETLKEETIEKLLKEKK